MDKWTTDNITTGHWDFPWKINEIDNNGSGWIHVTENNDLPWKIMEKWIHCWNNWHWTLSFSWIWPYWITLEKYKMADISKTRKLWETRMAVLHSALHSHQFGVPQAMVWKCFNLTYFLALTDFLPSRSNWGQKVILGIGSS